jgi:hypothetical protein
MGVLSALLLFSIVIQYLRPWPAAGVTLIFVLEPYHLYYSFWLLSTSLFTLVLLATWWAWDRAREQAGPWSCAVAGLLFGFLVLVWPGALLIPIFVLGAVAWAFSRSRTPSPCHRVTTSPFGLLSFSILTLATIIPPSLWMTRNKLVAGHFALSHQSGIVLAYFKATEVELWRQGRTKDRYVETSLNPGSREMPHRVWEEIDRRLCKRLEARADGGECADLRWYNVAQGNQTARDSFLVSKSLAAIGTSMLLDAPWAALTCGIARIAENLAFPLGLALAPPTGAPVGRFRSVALGGLYAALGLAAVAGVVRSRRPWRELYFPLACIIALSLATTPQIDPRFRAPMIPLLAFLALLPWRRAES